MVDTVVNKKVLLVILVTLMCTKVSSLEVLTRDFCYTEDWCGANEWEVTFSYCAIYPVFHPSPVNINPTYIIQNMSLGPIELLGFDTVQPGYWLVKNIRNTVALGFNFGMQMRGANFPREYDTLFATFHWGNADTNGSEHTYNGRSYPMEMQIYNTVPPYGNLMYALYSEMGSAAALAVFIDIGPEDNLLFEAISSALPDVPLPGDEVLVSPFPLRDLLPNDITKFYQYKGALTYPDCVYTVDWLIFEEPIYISQRQYNRFFTEVYYHEPDEEPPKLLYNNFRPIMALGGRLLTASPNATIPSAVSGLSANVLAVLSACLVSLLMKWTG